MCDSVPSARKIIACFFAFLKVLDIIADIHEQEGRVAEAYAVKHRVVTLDPSNFRAGRDLARLESTLLDRGGIPGYVTLN